MNAATAPVATSGNGEAKAKAPTHAAAADKRKLWADYFATAEKIAEAEATLETLKAAQSGNVKAIVDASGGQTTFSVDGRGLLKYRSRTPKAVEGQPAPVATHYFMTDRTVPEKVKL